MHSQRYISLLCMDSHKTQSPISLEICGLNGNVSERIEITGYHLHMYETKQNEKNIFFFLLECWTSNTERWCHQKSFIMQNDVKVISVCDYEKQL